MTREYVLKTVSLAAIAGMLVAGLLAVVISEIDQYYDWLLVEQSVGLGLAAGLITGAGIVYYQTTKHTLKPRLSAVIISYLNRRSPSSPKPVEPTKMAVEPSPASGPDVWGTIGRISLGGLLGLLVGGIGSIWYCVESYGSLSSDAQGWLLIYLPVYIIITISCAAMGCVAGAILGMMWRLLWPLRSKRTADSAP